MTTKRIRVAIAGAAGYTGGELIRLLRAHPHCDLVCAQSRSMAGKPVSDVHADLTGEIAMRFSESLEEGAYDALFLCLPHGESRRFLQDHPQDDAVRIIDLGQDFRLDETYTYGLPELQRQRICASRYVANPGCFATAIQLALLPLAFAGKLAAEIHVSAITGSTGAGRTPGDTTHFSWRSGQVSVYKPFQHQHLQEIYRSLRQAQEGYEGRIHFIPYRGNFTRGILASVYLSCPDPEEAIRQLYDGYYVGHPFVEVTDRHLGLKPVINTNRCFLHLEKQDDMLLITSAIDNLLKGASGQAVQNFNLMFGLEECCHLHSKPVVF